MCKTLEREVNTLTISAGYFTTKIFLFGLHSKEGMIAYLRDWLLYRDIITVSARDSFEGMNPRDIEELLDACTPESGIAPQPTDSVKKFRYLPKCAPALVRIWELAEKEYHKDRFNASVWQQIMARCNALYQLSLNKSSAAEIKSVIHA